MTELVRLGASNFPVVPQPHARLRHYLTGEDFDSIMSGDYAKNAYRILCILIPALDPKSPMNIAAGGGGMAEYEWEGFASREDMDAYRAGDRSVYSDEAAAKAPDFDQITLAFEMAVNVNGGARLGKLLGLVKQVQGMTEKMEQMTPQPTPPSPVMHGANGA